MNTITTISEKEFLKKVADGVSKEVIWKKPFLLLTKNSADYLYINDALSETYKSKHIVIEPAYIKFVRIDDKLEMSLNGEICNGHHPEIDIYKFLESANNRYDERTLQYCVDLVEYEGKPVISLICTDSKDYSIENIPAWMHDKFEIAMLKLDFSSYSGK
jgi:hypothetical protein